jgi:hypothetical protein
MKAKRRIESGSNSVTILDGSGGHVRLPFCHSQRDYSVIIRISPWLSPFMGPSAL